ncbi:MAG: MFS transporter [Dehalococcoidia bacterium]
MASTAAPRRAGHARQFVARAASRQFSALAEPNYRLFFLGQAVSLIGTWMQTVGQGWLVLQLTGSAAALGFVTMLQFLPFTLLSLVGGVLADRLPKRKTLVVLQSFATVQAVVLSAIVVLDVVAIWHIYVLAFCLGLTNALERPTRQSFFSDLVPPERLVNAVALNSTILNLARILGPALGGLMIAITGPQGTFIFNAFSFAAVLAGYALMDPSRFRTRPRRTGGGSFFRQIGGGFRYAFSAPQPRFILCLVAFVGLFGYNFNVVVPMVARFILDAGPAQFGLLTSSLGVGALISAFTIAGVAKQSLRLMLAAATVFSVLLFALGLSHQYWLSAALLLGLGVTGTAMMTMANTSLQLGAPDELRGRVISIYILLQAGSTPLGGLLVGQLGSHFGVSTALVVPASLALAGVLLVAAFHPQVVRFGRLRDA